MRIHAFGLGSNGAFWLYYSISIGINWAGKDKKEKGKSRYRQQVCVFTYGGASGIFKTASQSVTAVT